MLTKLTKPEFEDQRLLALKYLDVLDTGPDEGFDRLTRLIKTHFDVPIVLVGLIDEERQWFKSKLGFERSEIPREISLCTHTILGNEIVCFPDLNVVPKFAQNPLVQGDPHIRFYASVALTVDGGQNVGTLCIMDQIPRHMTTLQFEEFTDFGTCIEQQLLQGRVQDDANFLVSQTSRLNTLLETVADGIVTIDLEGRIESLNTVAAHIFGYEPYEILGQNVNDLMPGLGQGGWSAYTNLFFSENCVPPCDTAEEFYGRRKDGTVFPMDFSVREMNLDGKRLFTGIIRDITERRTVDDELKRGREVLEMTKETVPVGITVFDEHLRLSVVNTEAGRLLSLPKNLIQIGTDFADIVTYMIERGDYGTGDVQRKIESLQRIVLSNKSQRFVRQFSQYKHVEGATRPMPGGGFVSIFSDMTSHFENEAKLEGLLQQANTANQAKSDFLSSISHEIRTPLNGVIGVAHMLGDTNLDSDQQAKLDTILRSGNTLLELINDVLDMSKIEAGSLVLEVVACNLREVMMSVVQPFELQADEKGIKFTSYFDPILSTFHFTDPTRIRQVVLNLLSNALKFTEKGSVSLSVLVKEDAGHGEQLIQVSVEDTGVGISKSALKNVFESFSQADTSITRKYGGTGLGLSIVKNLVHLMEGKITLSSELGQGSCFRLTFPVKVVAKADEPKAWGIENTIDEYYDRPLNILVAEDNEVNAMITEAFLKKTGHTSEIANNGKAALEMLENGSFDLILMDVHMPEMDGIEATQKIRLMEQHKTLPIIGLTADAFSERHALFLEVGMNDVLTKPFTEVQLAEVLMRHRALNVTHLQEKGDLQEMQNTSLAVSSFFAASYGDPIGCDDKMKDFLNQLGADVTRSLIEKSPASIMEELESLREGLKNEDSQIVFRAAHTISGVAGSMCAERLAKQASLIEIKSVEIGNIKTVLPEMEKTVEDTIDWWSGKMDELLKA